MKSTKFCQYFSLKVLPQLYSIASLDDQTKILRILAASCVHTDDIEEPLEATADIYQILIVSMTKMSL